ncbi:MAG: helix-turn-helix domain-containing protein [Dehalococcoidales bacterium]|nr:helix-turn-helix domain-containing protein [Dehalococcoidales bacterium]
MSTILAEEYVTVAEAASMCKVSQSTIWRWIDSGELPAYRLGHRRVLVKKTDLADLLVPARHSYQKGERMLHQERQIFAPLTGREQKQMLRAIEEARRLQRGLLDRRAGKPFPSSEELIHRSRDQRSADLQ